jgi:hypothetical protein
MNRAVLEKSFSAELVKTRRNGAGKELAFVSAVHYIKRLNEAFDSHWTWKILSHEIQGSEVVVHGVLEAAGESKHAFGGWTVTADKTTGEVMSVADDLKAAATDAMKKAASLFGVGLDLYLKDDDASPSATARPREEVTANAAPDDGGRNRITAKQLKAIFAISRIKNISDAQLRQTCIRKFGTPPDFLSKANASEFIDDLKAS